MIKISTDFDYESFNCDKFDDVILILIVGVFHFCCSLELQLKIKEIFIKNVGDIRLRIHTKFCILYRVV